ncbi:bifunctional phosphopantothenoylcysteine decarboxylase/phosphopantothenate--cysteine ligase CoaBC [Galbibacter sp.]|uniref:bifunctional phosphopantothenoylcysteine decarboxylase/phosphopantothenate--cysteine ligase CoaBC n=1 Tax=Galbibacter sp. TaxID=2918471 RepID=UPI002CB4DB47|nr:bifunctional phosphopantothenoylcysteine decarboxylase/phosphopantothenate--cysteine ligase CoaBC [Galbibacter sp.]HLV64019.1 bifunctional phosphopantothenoylcysteine decarboxylase/phosphopantothenate--cysteine ligase CoaBC [Galbibacter sp.]
MSILSGKKVLLGISGGIAAYKSAFLVRLLIKAGASVKVVMTENSKEFVTPLTLSTLSKNRVYWSFTDSENKDAVWNNHVDLGLWADLMIIAPATANTMSKMASGTSDNFLLATYLSARCPVFIAPAMDLDMYAHASTQENIGILVDRGNHIIPAESGELASGLIGQGRMAEPESIVSLVENLLKSSLPLYGKKILVTAGPTYEAIDPVRFIGNHSSGRMGFELASHAAQLGAEVFLVTGPCSLTLDNPLVRVVRVQSADQMYNAVHQVFNQVNIAILAAAVADYKPAEVADQKIKKKTANLHIDLVPTSDILASLGKIKTDQFLVGFALETQNELDNAVSKLQRKNLDAIVLNSLNDTGAGFGKSTNKITFIDKNLNRIAFPLKSKAEVAIDIFNEIRSRLHA